MGVWSGDTEIFVRYCMCNRVRMTIGFSQGIFTESVHIEFDHDKAFFHCLECGAMEWVDEELEQKEKRSKEDDQT